MNQPQQINGLPVAMSGGTVHPPGNIQAPADLGVAAAGWNGLGAVVPGNPAGGAATALGNSFSACRHWRGRQVCQYDHASETSSPSHAVFGNSRPSTTISVRSLLSS